MCIYLKFAFEFQSAQECRNRTLARNMAPIFMNMGLKANVSIAKSAFTIN